MDEIIVAIKEGDIDSVRKLIPGLNINFAYKDKTPLIVSVESNQYEITKMLLENGADVDMAPKTITPLIYAAQFNQLEIIKLLIKYGADVNFKNAKNQTPIYYSVGNNKLEATKLLIELGADVNSKNTDELYPLFYSVYNNNFEITKLLLESGANVNSRGMLISARNHEIVQLLLDYGANPFINTRQMLCQSEECLRAVETAAWQRLWKRDLQTAQILGKSILNKDVWQLILLNERQRMLCNNPNSSTNKYLLQAFAEQLGASDYKSKEKIKNMTKSQLCALISQNIGRSTQNAEDEIKRAKMELEKNSRQIRNLARKFNIDADGDLLKVITDISQRLK